MTTKTTQDAKTGKQTTEEQLAKAAAPSAPATNENGEKTEFFHDYDKERRLTSQLQDIIYDFGKTVLPAMELLGIHLTSVEQVMKYTDKNELAKAYAEEQVKQEKTENGGHLSKRLQKIIRNSCTAEALGAIADQIYKAQQTGSHWATKPSPTLQGYMYIDPTDGALSYDVQKVYDECTKYLTNAEKPAYDKLTQISKELNDLTKGKFAIEQLLQTATVNPDTHETLCVVNPRAPFAELAMMMG